MFVVNCLDRHVAAGKGDKIAFIYTNERRQERKVSYAQLLEMVKKFANGLKSLGVGKGDRVCFYMPLTIEQIVAMLACARIGAVHSVVYAGFSAQALQIRTEDAQAKVILTSAWTERRGKKIPLKQVVDEAAANLDFVSHIIVDRRGDDIELGDREIDFHELMNAQSA